MEGPEERSILLIHHTHPYSPEYIFAEEKIPELEKYTTLYYDDFVRSLPDGTDAVFTKTDHWKPRSGLFRKLKDKVKKDGGFYRQFEKHCYFEVDGHRAAVINGVEGSIEYDRYHVTLNGIRIGEEREYQDMSVEKFYREVRDSEFTVPAHPLSPTFRIPDRILKPFLKDGEEDYRAGIGFPTGYGRLTNWLSRGYVRELLGGDSLFSLSEDYGVPLVPEIDWHGGFPEDLDGVGRLEEGSMERMRYGDIPVDSILYCDIEEGHFSGVRPGDIVRSFPELSSGVLGWFIDSPETPEQYEKFLKDVFEKIDVRNQR